MVSMSNKIHPILKAIIPLAKGISKTLGSNCEYGRGWLMSIVIY